MLDETTALVIERDNGVGTADKACADPKKPQPIASMSPSKVKRIYKIAFDRQTMSARKCARSAISICSKIADPENKKPSGWA
jgi:hypothetical protein